MSGIFRDVYVYNVPLVSVRDHYITSSLRAEDGYKSGSMKVELTLDNSASEQGVKGFGGPFTESGRKDGCRVGGEGWLYSRGFVK